MVAERNEVCFNYTFASLIGIYYLENLWRSVQIHSVSILNVSWDFELVHSSVTGIVEWI